MQLWQLDIMGAVLLIDGRKLKLISGIDDPFLPKALIQSL